MPMPNGQGGRPDPHGNRQQPFPPRPRFVPIPPDDPTGNQNPKPSFRWGRLLVVILVLCLLIFLVPFLLGLLVALGSRFASSVVNVLSEGPPELEPFTHEHYKLWVWGFLAAITIGVAIRLARKI